MKNKYPMVSIIIPLYVISDRFFEDFKKFEKLDYPNFEIIVVCDKKVDLPKLKKVPVAFLLTGHKQSGPAEKRDIALKKAKGEICAFIDDDAYPNPDWLKQAVGWMDAERIVAVGGPGVTPPENTYWQKIAGYIIESYLCSGGIQYRFYPGRFTFFVQDYPAYNLLVKTKILKKVGGYGSTFYGGEDTLLCLKLIQHGEILYDPRAIVYHHRREFPGQLLKQIAGVGLHRGYFFKKYPETSRSIFYLLPTALTVSFLFAIFLLIIYPTLFLLPFSFLFLLVILIGAVSVYNHKTSLVEAITASLGIVITHITYGVYFIKGLFTKKLLR
jgi:cellulose synthase/poly-beta-1,6-N-acetylglucosamine synthase-like glycosyltransferase